MQPILKIGSILRVDSEGFLINDCDGEAIAPPWDVVVAEPKNAYCGHFADMLHSIYLRGSIARGRAIEGISDVDLILVLFSEATVEDLAWSNDCQKRCLAQFPFCTKIEVEFVSYAALLYAAHYHFTRFMIKTQSVCIAGEDLRPRLPGYKPNRQIAFHTLTIAKDLEVAARYLQKTTASHNTQNVCQWIMKRLLRAAGEVVMEEEQAYTRDLYPCYEMFSRHYPAHREAMRRALEFAVNPSANETEVQQYLAEFGPQLMEIVQAKMGRT